MQATPWTQARVGASMRSGRKRCTSRAHAGQAAGLLGLPPLGVGQALGPGAQSGAPRCSHVCASSAKLVSVSSSALRQAQEPTAKHSRGTSATCRVCIRHCLTPPSATLGSRAWRELVPMAVDAPPLCFIWGRSDNSCSEGARTARPKSWTFQTKALHAHASPTSVGNCPTSDSRSPQRVCAGLLNDAHTRSPASAACARRCPVLCCHVACVSESHLRSEARLRPNATACQTTWCSVLISARDHPLKKAQILHLSTSFLPACPCSSTLTSFQHG